MDDVELDLRNMDVKKWRTRTLNRTEWAFVVGEYMAYEFAHCRYSE